VARPGSPHAQYSTTLELDMGTVKPSLAGPKRPQDRVLLEDVQKNYREALVGMTANRDKRSDDVSSFVNEGGGAAVGNEQLAKGFADIEIEGRKVRLKDGAVVIAAITSCTNTSNPAVMIGAGLLARNAAAKGLNRQPWVKTSLGPGSRVVTDYLEKAGVLKDLRSSASTWSATAAPPASATPARCRPKSAPASPPATWWSPRCCRATATSRAACTPK
jgi:aconitate hydratase